MACTYGNRQLSGVHWLVSLPYLQRLRQVREPRRDPVSSKRGTKCEERHPRLCSGLYLHEHTCGCTHLHPYSLPYMHGYMHADINTHTHTKHIQLQIQNCLYTKLIPLPTIHMYIIHCLVISSSMLLPTCEVLLHCPVEKKCKKDDKYRFIVTDSFILNGDFCIFGDTFLVHFMLL